MTHDLVLSLNSQHICTAQNKAVGQAPMARYELSQDCHMTITGQVLIPSFRTLRVPSSSSSKLVAVFPGLTLQLYSGTPIHYTQNYNPGQ